MFSIYRQLFDLLDRSERRQFYVLLGLVIAMALVDLVGVAAVLPFLSVAADPTATRDSRMLSFLRDASGVTSDQGFVIFLGLLVLGFILFGMAVKLVGQYRIVRFGHLRNDSLSRRLLASYLAQNYVWFLGHNSAHLGAAILSECDKVVGGVLLPSLRVIANTVSLIFLIGLLIFVSPAVAFSAAVGIGGVYAVIFLLVRQRLQRQGQQQIKSNAARYQLTSEAFGGLKDVKFMGFEQVYNDRYKPQSRSYAEACAQSQIIGELPRFLLEAIAFGGLIVIILGLLVFQGARMADILPTLAIFGFAILKIFPAVQQIYHSLTQMRNGAPLLAKLHAEFSRGGLPALPEEVMPTVAPMVLSNSLVLEAIHFSYPTAGRAALQGLTLAIKARTTVGIVGGTGAGKTTVVDIILGLLTPDSGRMLVDDVPVTTAKLRAWQNAIGYVPQQIFLTDDTVAANIAFGIPPELRDIAAIERAARLAELHEFVTTELPQGYATVVGERGVRLSGGQRQRIGIARALYRDPEVLILDEATSALDNLTERAVMDAVTNLAHAKTIIMIAHRLSTVRGCDRIFLLEGGKVAANGTFDELVAENETFRRMAS